MAESELDPPVAGPEAVQRRWWRRSRGRTALVVALGVLALLLGGVWLMRYAIADHFITGQLRTRGIPATYKVARIGLRTQIIEDLVIGDPAHPDLTVKRLTVLLNPRLGIPTLGRLVVEQPRLVGSLSNGTLSFGSLDKVLFGGPKRTFRMPNLNLAIHDGRALMRTDWGPVGVKLEGAGKLREGFAGIAAIAAPRLVTPGCRIDGGSLYGAISVHGEKPSFGGPLRAARLECPGAQLSVAGAAVTVQTLIDADLQGAKGTATIVTGPASQGGRSARTLNGTSRVSFRKGSMTATYDVKAAGVSGGEIGAGELTLDGTFRARNSFARIDIDGGIAGRDVRLGTTVDSALGTLQNAGQDTLLAPLVAQMRAALVRESRGSTLSGRYIVRRTGTAISAVIPSAGLIGGSGQPLVTLSRLQFGSAPGSAPNLSGNFATGGPGIPRIEGRMEAPSGQPTLIRMTMPEYRAGTSSLALPELVVALAGNGGIGFGGRAVLSGPLPGGSARDLAVPLDGTYSRGNGLSVWRRCTRISFASLTYANLTLDRRALTLCPGKGGAILRSDARGTRIAAGAPSLQLSGHLGATPIRISSGAVGFAIPGAIAARTLDVSLGPVDRPARFTMCNLTANIGKDISGRFAGTTAKLYSVPLDVVDASGSWRYAAGRLSIASADFRLVDRSANPRFQPLAARGGSLTLFNNVIDAKATLRNPRSDRIVTDAAIRHNLASGVGYANLAVPGILFDNRLQPADVTRLALGVIANTSGTLYGKGRIDWSPRGVTSTGDFSTDGLDFAAVFGPVRGARGTIHFSDLLALETPPGQVLHVDSVNPGIEVTDGVVTFQLKRGQILQLEGATWPFMGGTLKLLPVTFNLGTSEVRKYVLVVSGLDAAQFIARMQITGFSATGIFDGQLPLEFTPGAGGRIVGGFLSARPPGGNIAYVGPMSFKDKGFIANFAFEALRSIDYRAMTIAMDGALQGEIATRIRFDGVHQGATAKKNFITKAFAKLPLQVNLNIRAPFYQLITTLKALNDPSYVKDPRDLGLLDDEGRPIRRQVTGPQVPPATKPTDIQPPATRTVP
ncbi:intermembrane phospholipid transport protein YdbH family protein [Parablastomonas sp. CN1-191]|uniref:intermembrane phospholipid transport protein YdbH family protein n=1 Tax=Parablastomonas sp. CN1-191 TaxID=3400908 RepID=UPI003BF800F1